MTDPDRYDNFPSDEEQGEAASLILDLVVAFGAALAFIGIVIFGVYLGLSL